MNERYCKLVLDVPLDFVSREASLPILIEDFFAPCGARLLSNAESMIPGPDILQILECPDTPIDAVFKWLDEILQAPSEKRLYPETTGTNRTDREKVSRWRAGIDLPSAQSVKLLSETVRDVLGECNKANALALWLMIATAIARFERDGATTLRKDILRALKLPPTESVLQNRLLTLVQQVGHRLPELAEPSRMLWHELRRTSVKCEGDQEKTFSAIERLNTEAARYDPSGLTAYHYQWMWARWHTLSGQYEEAVARYHKAFELASYRAGHQIKDIIEDAICVAGFLGKKAFLKQLKHTGIVLGLFTKPQPGTVVLEEWELDQFSQQLFHRFPSHGRFIESVPDLSVHAAPGLLAISTETIATYKVDLRTPNRVRSVTFDSGELRRWTQLRLFASFGQVSQVSALIEAGASVDILDNKGSSALLCALQFMEGTGERGVLDVLLNTPHQVSTMNAMTGKKKWTPLLCAVHIGVPDVVKALLEMQANPNQYAGTDHQTPLYCLVTQLLFKTHPSKMFEKLTHGMLGKTDLQLRDAMRRYGIASSGIYGERNDLIRAHPDLAMKKAHDLVSHHDKTHAVSRLLEIALVLLENGANPNAPHNYPVPGRTPLMLAAESNLPEVFDLMVQHGGEPLKPDAFGQNCVHIAKGFGAEKISGYLRYRGYQ